MDIKGQLTTLESLLEEQQAEKRRTPFLEVAAGAMHTAIANLEQHEEALAKIEQAKQAAVASEAAKIEQALKG